MCIIKRDNGRLIVLKYWHVIVIKITDFEPQHTNEHTHNPLNQIRIEIRQCRNKNIILNMNEAPFYQFPNTFAHNLN